MPKNQCLGVFMAVIPLITVSSNEQGAKGQGIEGYVYRISGNQMPSPDIKPSPLKGVRTTLYVYGLTNLSQVIKHDQGPFYESVQTKLIRKVETDSTGYFNVQLPVGRYSLFAKKGTLFFANWFDGNNNIAPVEVVAKKITKVVFKIDYDAAY
ncbi:MAG TPA: hypothetical protein VK543_04770 [Puia sp.]|nr:hypothetical protein [Puia sp.]